MLQGTYDAEKQLLWREWARGYLFYGWTKPLMCSVKVQFLAYLRYICKGEEMPSGGLVYQL